MVIEFLTRFSRAPAVSRRGSAVTHPCNPEAMLPSFILLAKAYSLASYATPTPPSDLITMI